MGSWLRPAVWSAALMITGCGSSQSCVTSRSAGTWCTNDLPESSCIDSNSTFAEMSCEERGFTEPCDETVGFTFRRPGGRCPGDD